MPHKTCIELPSTKSTGKENPAIFGGSKKIKISFYQYYTIDTKFQFITRKVKPNLLLTKICTSFWAYCPDGAVTLHEYTPASAGSAGQSNSSPPLLDKALPEDPTSKPPRCHLISL